MLFSDEKIHVGNQHLTVCADGLIDRLIVNGPANVHDGRIALAGKRKGAFKNFANIRLRNRARADESENIPRCQ